MTWTRTWLAVLGTAALAGCATGHTVDKARTVDATGSAFTQALAGDYSELAVYEADEMGDWRDANTYADRSLRAADGNAFPPVKPGTRGVGGEHLAELRQARGKLMDAFDKGARSDHPKLAARAQSQYDCWVEQQEEAHQADHIAACRQGFKTALKDLRSAMEPDEQMAEAEAEETQPAEEEKSEPEPVEPQRYAVNFGHDSARVSSGQIGPLHDAAAFARDHPETDIRVIGYTDTSGNAEYNRELSMNRARNVRDILVEFGLARDRIAVDARGETNTAVTTGQDVRERSNRRVVVTVE